VPRLVFAVTELRNAVAHDGAVFDTRFARAKVRKEVGGLLSRELGFEPTLSVDFRTITDYPALVVYLCVRLRFAKRDVHQATSAFAALSDELRSQVHRHVFDQIVHSGDRGKVRRIEAWIRATWTRLCLPGEPSSNRGAPSRGPPETAGCFRPFPFFGACGAGLELAGLIAHPSRNEILSEIGHAMTIAPFAARVIAVLPASTTRVTASPLQEDALNDERGPRGPLDGGRHPPQDPLWRVRRRRHRPAPHALPRAGWRARDQLRAGARGGRRGGGGTRRLRRPARPHHLDVHEHGGADAVTRRSNVH